MSLFVISYLAGKRMTPVFIADFRDRKRQVRHYLATVRNAERSTKLRPTTGAHDARLMTLRAGTFLILYNLIEATTRAAIDSIHDRITSAGIPFGRLSLSLRKEVIRKFRRHANPAKNHTMDDFPAAFVAVALDQEIRLAGNVDARFLRDLGEIYGFTCRTSEGTLNGSDLLTVKTNRNDLAHGLKTFEQVGRDYPFRDLLELSLRSMQFMNEILNNVAFYLEGKVYLAEVADVADNGGANRAA